MEPLTESIVDFVDQSLLAITGNEDTAFHLMVGQTGRRDGNKLPWYYRVIFGIGLSLIFAFMCYGGLLFLWSLEGWGILDFQWLYDIYGYMESWSESLMRINFISEPIAFLERLLLAFETHENFQPSNTGFIWFFAFFLYPILWIISNEFAPIVIGSVPYIAFFFLIDPWLFQDPIKVIKTNIPGRFYTYVQINDEYPRAGLPTWLSTFYGIDAMLWFDFSYLVNKYDLNFEWLGLLWIYLFSWFQIAFTTAVDPVMGIWAFIATISLGFITFYEVIVHGFSFMDAAQWAALPEEIQEATSEAIGKHAKNGKVIKNDGKEKTPIG